MADVPRTLGDYLAQLKQAEVVPKPAGELWKEYIERISVPGRIAEICESAYDYWLEVLPPKWMRGGHFCFAEGAEAFRLLWHDRPTSRYFCRQLTWDETVTFCRLAGIPLPW